MDLWLSSKASGNGRNDLDPVTFLEGAVQSLPIANVFVVDVDVDETADLSVTSVKILLQFRMGIAEFGKNFLNRFS